ncbi:protein kinase [Nonomuraea sp. SMC257]|uniref:non-specific serine/threonine protein kinase n=1 Tax=Nonomuraea montanisoli TaxID=2741721 RepID=A0A7Y6ICV6_9ACTN|nr:serine/threonine-protein kinase [Nonomuraea montanisoli]NUW35318.1 protein kinase [Nonomuraea montanisoli]
MPEPQTRVLAERYELISPLGRGTMGTVWRARDRALGREVAVKEIRQDPGLTEEQRAELRERMVREGRIAARISHPAVAAIHDVLIQDDSPWIIMELVEARSLEQVIDEEGPLPPRLVAEIGVDLLGALRAAHAQGITHRDVKPGNVLITETGRVVLTDFGIAKAEGDPKLTKTGMVIGSPGYTAPERARGEYTGPESDIWSLGATLYFAVEGRPAYERASIAETLAALLSENADPPTQAGQLGPVLTGLLHKDHKKRLNAAKAETMLRMVADTPTHEIPVITAESPTGQETSVPDASHPASGSRTPGASGPQQGAGARPQGGRSAAAPGSGPQSAGPQGAPGGRPAAQGPGGEGGQPRHDPERTVALKRPKTPLPGRPQPGAPVDEGAMATQRIQTPRPYNAPGHQVYPPAQQPGRPVPPGGQPPRPVPAGHAVSHPGPAQGYPPGPQGPQGMSTERPDSKGLGTDLFAIAGPEERPTGNRTGMLVLMGVAAAAAVMIAILIVAVLQG